MPSVLVIGSGGREHAICTKLAESERVEKIYVTPGNAGTDICDKTTNVALSLKDFDGVGSWCKQHKIDLVIVGPEAPLADGIADCLEKHGIDCFGPVMKAAQIESSKAFAKSFMDKYSIPTARWKSFTNANEAVDFIKNAPFKALVVKASGLAAGKGVIVANNNDEAIQAVHRMMEDNEFGAAGDTVVVEELLEGPEVSCLAFCDGKTSVCFPPAQDHKRVGEGDTGPNTGGMGAYAPCPLISAEDFEIVKRDVIQKAVDGMVKEGTPYKGVLYAGLMLTRDGPKVLEYNCRFGDPEAQVIIPLVKSDFYITMKSCVKGELNKNCPEFFHDRSNVAVVMVSGGYPGSYEKGHAITGLDQLDHPGVSVIHAGTAMKDGQLVTSGGRVLALVAHHKDLETAINMATKACNSVQFKGAFYRRDIGRKALQKSLSYADSGVSISAGNELVELIKPLAKMTSRPGCDVDLGMFAGMFDLKAAGYKDPLLVSGTDGVGTKLKIAQMIGKHDTIGQDLVAMCVNDVLCHGAEPLFFLDYLACGRLDVATAKDVVSGVASACRTAGCALLGGETAEMPGMYKPGEYDLAGFTVGAVERGHTLPNIDKINAGDVLIGIASNGLHSNGFSLVRKVVETYGYDYTMPSPFNAEKSLGDALLVPTKIYSKSLLPALRSGHVRAFAHITGGGLLENIPRVLPKALGVELDSDKWEIPDVFGWLRAQGNIPEAEMARTFNCGIGAVLVTSPEAAADVIKMVTSSGERAWPIGKVVQLTQSECQERVSVKNLDANLKRIGSKFNLVNSSNGFKMKMKVGVLISGSGTNLQALIDDSIKEHSEAEIALVISNVADVQGLERAKRAGIPTLVIPHKEYKSRLEFDMEVDRKLREAEVELVCLAGFMRILTPEFTKKWAGRLLNVHPSLLPSFKGSNAHKLVLEAGVRISGCTVHFVTPEVDAGAILVQEPVPVYPEDTVTSLQERIKTREHVAFPKAMQLVASGKAKFNAEDNKVIWS